MLAWWTIGRASGLGASAGLAAFLLWPLYRAYGWVAWPFAVAGGIAAVCGASILLMTIFDIVLHRRGARIRPVRGFDLVLGVGLIGVAVLVLEDVRGLWPG